MADTRKTDRRTVYTKKAIGDAFLQAKRNKDYNTITVADICREAEISRGTFYAHSSNISEVLDALLNDAFANMDYLRNYMSAPGASAGPQCAYPFCRNEEWCPVQNMIDRFIKGGISSFPKQTT